jgi:hypothetical protein
VSKEHAEIIFLLKLTDLQCNNKLKSKFKDKLNFGFFTDEVEQSNAMDPASRCNSHFKYVIDYKPSHLLLNVWHPQHKLNNQLCFSFGYKLSKFTYK